MWNRIFPEQASSIAGDVDLIIIGETLLALVFALPVAFLVVYFAVRYRRGVPRERFTEIHEGRGHGQTWLLEVAWIGGLLILALSVFAWGARIYFNIYAMPATGMDIYVVGKQWMWKFQHPTGHTEIDELHVPVDFPVRLTMISEDVIHSFYVPAFRIKRDVVPGEYTTVWFEATEPGVYDLFCAEYCGTEHSGMIARVHVLEATDYQAWLSQRDVGGISSVIPQGEAGEAATGGELTPMTMASAGEALFGRLGCDSCHRPEGGGAGPSLVGVWESQRELENGQTVLADIDYIRRSILDPQAEVVAGYPPIMPTFEGQISEEELNTLIEYIRSLGEDAQAAEDAQTGEGSQPDEEPQTDEGAQPGEGAEAGEGTETGEEMQPGDETQLSEGTEADEASQPAEETEPGEAVPDEEQVDE